MYLLKFNLLLIFDWYVNEMRSYLWYCVTKLSSVRYECQLLDFTLYVVGYVSINMNDSYITNDMY